MNKSYRCDFCEHDRPTTNEYCSGCKRASGFELKKRMTERQADEWLGHRKLDKYIDSLPAKLSDYQRDTLHRVIETPRAGLWIPHSLEYRRMRLELLDAIQKVTLEDEE